MGRPAVAVRHAPDLRRAAQQEHEARGRHALLYQRDAGVDAPLGRSRGKLNDRLASAIEVDWILWEMGLTTAPDAPPYHLTRTTAY